MNYYNRTIIRDMERIRHSIEREKAKMQSTIQWKFASKELPEHLKPVMIAFASQGDVNLGVWIGYYLADKQLWSSAFMYDKVTPLTGLNVIAWAQLPTPPHI